MILSEYSTHLICSGNVDRSENMGPCARIPGYNSRADAMQTVVAFSWAQKVTHAATSEPARAEQRVKRRGTRAIKRKHSHSWQHYTILVHHAAVSRPFGSWWCQSEHWSRRCGRLATSVQIARTLSDNAAPSGTTYRGRSPECHRLSRRIYRFGDSTQIRIERSAAHPGTTQIVIRAVDWDADAFVAPRTEALDVVG